MTKLAAEHLAVLYHRSFGLPTVSLRYFTVYGPRQRPDMAFHRFFKAARDDEPVSVFGDGRQTRDFTFVTDVARAFLLAARARFGRFLFFAARARFARRRRRSGRERRRGCRNAG